MQEISCFLQVLERILFDRRQESCVQTIGFLELWDLLTLEDLAVRVAMQINQDKPENFSKIETCDHFLKGLLTGTWRLLVDDNIVRSSRENFVLVVEGAPFAVDGHWEARIEIHVRKLRY